MLARKMDTGLTPGKGRSTLDRTIVEVAEQLWLLRRGAVDTGGHGKRSVND